MRYDPIIVTITIIIIIIDLRPTTFVGAVYGFWSDSPRGPTKTSTTGYVVPCHASNARDRTGWPNVRR